MLRVRQPLGGCSRGSARRCSCVAESAMMVFQVNTVTLAKIAKAVGLMAGITPPHSRARAKLWEAEAPFETLVFVRNESVIEIDAMRDKYPVVHELHEAVSDLRKHRSSLDHVRTDSGQPRD